MTFNSIFKLFFTFTTVISGWTSIILLSDTSLKSEIYEVVTKMYLNQKEFVFNVKDLSFLLVKDANQRFYKNHKNVSQWRIINYENKH